MARIAEKVKQDKNGERIIHSFLENNFYPLVESYSSYDKSSDKEMQLKGIDTTFTYNGFEYKCDEKAALDYVNGIKGYELKTFCLELSFLDRNDKLQDGWFVKDSLETNSYLFVWLDTAKKDVLEEVSDIDKIEIALVRKEKLIEYLNGLGWTKENLKKKSHNIRFNGDRKFGNCRENGCKFSNPRLPEQPVNVLISRYKLIQLSDFHRSYEASNS